MIPSTIYHDCYSCGELRTYAWRSLNRSGRVLVGHERSPSSTTVLVMFKTTVVLWRLAMIF